jgi:RsiW-degrading membrane proteinase PrsW (M82 family)
MLKFMLCAFWDIPYVSISTESQFYIIYVFMFYFSRRHKLS